MEEHQKVVQMRLLPVFREITDSRAKSRDELDALYRRIVTYIILCSGLGSVSDITNVQEATGETHLKRLWQIHLDIITLFPFRFMDLSMF